MTTDLVLDYESVRDWRVALYPAGTPTGTAVAGEVTKQAGLGRTILLGSVTVLPSYVVTTAAGLQDIVGLFGTLAIRYQVVPT